MASKIDICNLALGRLGQDGISDINEASAFAVYCRRFYDPARRAALRRYEWDFAKKVGSLNQLSSETSYKFDYVYQKPSDCIRVLTIHPSDTFAPDSRKISFEVIGDQIHTDESNARILYIWNLTDTTKFDDLFVDAFSVRLAVDLAMPITRDPNWVKTLIGIFNSYEITAQKVTAKETVKFSSAGRGILDARK